MMNPTFGCCDVAPGHLLSAKTFQKLDDFEVEKLSYQISAPLMLQKWSHITPSKLLFDLCQLSNCNGEYLTNLIASNDTHLKALEDFFLTREGKPLCVLAEKHCIKEQSSFKITASEDSVDELMVTQTIKGYCFLFVLESKFDIKSPSIITKRLIDAINAPVNCDVSYFKAESIEISVFDNYSKLVYNKVPITMEILKEFNAWSKNHEPDIIRFEFDDFNKSMLSYPTLHTNFEKLYLMTKKVKHTVAEILATLGVEEKTIQTQSVASWKQQMMKWKEDLEKNSHFLKITDIQNAMNFQALASAATMEDLKRWVLTKKSFSLDSGVAEIAMECLGKVLQKAKAGNCKLINSALFYKLEAIEAVKPVFAENRVILIREKNFNQNWKKWVPKNFLNDYPQCLVMKSPETSIEDALLFVNGTIYGFGIISGTKKASQSKDVCPADFISCCPNKKHSQYRFWKCEKCDVAIKSNTKGLLACKCGTFSNDKVQFKCAAASSEKGYCEAEKFVMVQKPTAKEMGKTVNGKTDPSVKKETTIVLLGPQRSGKSTLINAIKTYLEFETIEEASKKKAAPLISTQIFINDEKFKRYELKVVGSVIGNENFNSMGSVTAKPLKYTVETPDRVYNFIDTPGYGPDTKSEDHMKVLKFLGEIKKIDAVWIVLSAVEKFDVTPVFRNILMLIPRILFPRVNYVFTHAHKDDLIMNRHISTIAAYFDSCKGLALCPENVYPIENGGFGTLVAYQRGLLKTLPRSTWAISKSTALNLLEKASTPNPEAKNAFLAMGVASFYYRAKYDNLFQFMKITEKFLASSFYAKDALSNPSSPKITDVLKELSGTLHKTFLTTDEERDFLKNLVETYKNYENEKESKSWLSYIKDKVF